MKLLIDVGNSRVKWGVHNGLTWEASGNSAHTDIMVLAEQWRRYPAISAVYAANVASKMLQKMIEEVAPAKVRWIVAEPKYEDIVNHYRNVDEQGADRWLAVLAARQRCREDLLVVSAGTALTIECLTHTGDYLGGSILPGYTLMLSSLAAGTARLGVHQIGAMVEFPRSTEEAIRGGVMDGLTGAIERARNRFAAYTGRGLPRIVMTGGEATHIARWLAPPVDIVENLVLEGLLKVATE